MWAWWFGVVAGFADPGGDEVGVVWAVVVGEVLVVVVEGVWLGLEDVFDVGAFLWGAGDPVGDEGDFGVEAGEFAFFPAAYVGEAVGEAVGGEVGVGDWVVVG